MAAKASKTTTENKHISHSSIPPSASLPQGKKEGQFSGSCARDDNQLEEANLTFEKTNSTGERFIFATQGAGEQVESGEDVTMGACYPKCMNQAEDVVLQPGVPVQRKSKTSDTIYAKDSEANRERLHTYDLEELGLQAASLSVQEFPPSKSIVVDYEESQAVPSRSATSHNECAPDVCRPLDALITSNPAADAVDVMDKTENKSMTTNQKLPRRRSRRNSSEFGVNSLRGKSVVLLQSNINNIDDSEIGVKEPLSPSTTDADDEVEDVRCSKTHKLCLCEVSRHKTVESCWLVANNQVYDVTGVVKYHPGGPRSILRKAGGPDCTQDMLFHTKKARKWLEKCFIGKLRPCGPDEAENAAANGNCSIM